MGKGDIKTKRGKIHRGTYGKTRPKKKTVAEIIVEKKATPKKKKATPKPKKEEAPKVESQQELEIETPEVKEEKKPAAKKTTAKKTTTKTTAKKTTKKAEEKAEEAKETKEEPKEEK